MTEGFMAKNQKAEQKQIIEKVQKILENYVPMGPKEDTYTISEKMIRQMADVSGMSGTKAQNLADKIAKLGTDCNDGKIDSWAFQTGAMRAILETTKGVSWTKEYASFLYGSVSDFITDIFTNAKWLNLIWDSLKALAAGQMTVAAFVVAVVRDIGKAIFAGQDTDAALQLQQILWDGESKCPLYTQAQNIKQ